MRGSRPFFIFLLTRIVGRRELSSLEPFDLILLIVLGDPGTLAKAGSLHIHTDPYHSIADDLCHQEPTATILGRVVGSGALGPPRGPYDELASTRC